MSTDALDYLQRQWRSCYQEQKRLADENKALRAELAEADRKRDIAVTNAYEDGYRAGREDTLQDRRRHRA